MKRLDGEVGIEIAAAGRAVRMRDHIVASGLPEDYPKLLLPTGNPNGETLLGRIIRQSMDAPIDGSITIHTSKENEAHILDHPDLEPLIDEQLVRTKFMRYGNSFLAFLPKLVTTKQRVIGSSSDYYADFTWRSVLDAHDSSPFPVTFVAGRTDPVESGFVFEVDDANKVTGFHRPERTEATDPINVGIYIFEATKPVLTALHGLVSSRDIAKEEVIVGKLVEQGLLGIHVLDTTPYNVNTPETYQNLLAHTAISSSVASTSQ